MTKKRYGLTLCLLYLAALCIGAPFKTSSAQTALAPPASTQQHHPAITITSDNFTLIGNIERARGQELVLSLEQFRAAMRQIYGAQQMQTDQDLRIYFITDPQIYAELAPTRDTSAFYYNSLIGPEIVLNGSVDNYKPEWTRDDLFHEYMHHLNRHYLDYSIPTWLNEGLAEYYAKTRAMGEGYVTGHVQSQHLAALITGRWTPLETLFDTLHGYPFPSGAQERFGANSERRQSQFYAQSWLIVHYLMQQEAGMEKLRRFIQNLDPLGGNSAAFETQFGMDYAAFTKALQAYASASILEENFVSAPASLTSSALITTALPMRDHQSELYLLMSQAAESYQSGQPQKRIDAQLLSSGGMSTLGYLAKASKSYFDGDYALTQSQLLLAKALEPDLPRVTLMNAILGFYIWQDALDPAGDYKAETIRANLRAAIAQNPNHNDLKLMFISTFNPVEQDVDAELRSMVNDLIAANYSIKNPENALAMITPLQDMRRYSDIYDILDIAQVWIRSDAMRLRAQSLRYRIQADEQRRR